MKIIYDRKAKKLLIDGEGQDIKVPFLVEIDDLTLDCRNINLTGEITTYGMQVVSRIRPKFRQRLAALWRKLFPQKPSSDDKDFGEYNQYGVDKKENP